MVTMLFDPKPAIVGHRGFGRGTVPVNGGGTVAENTVESFLAAAEAGLSWVEVDVQRTADDQLVVRHDPALDGEFVIEHSAAQLREKGIVSFAEVLAALPPSVNVNVDVKTVIEDAVDDPSRRTAALLEPVLAAEARRRRVLVSSFDPGLLVRLRERVPEIGYGLLGWIDFPLRHAVAAAANLGLQAVCLHTGSFGRNRVENRPVHRPAEFAMEIAHRAGLEVLVWCPVPEDASTYVAAGVDALCVNDIPGTLAALRRRAPGEQDPAPDGRQPATPPTGDGTGDAAEDRGQRAGSMPVE